MPKFRDLKRYCERTGWTEVGSGRDHYYFQKILDDGIILETKVSHALGKEIPSGLWHKILKQQLKTNQEEFNKNS